ncbi:MAG: nitroreductase family protein [Anaerolineales bacterium]|nr:nitroreductase family protein [Anaerolineales bacterium]
MSTPESLDIIMKRRSIRRYLPKEVEREQLGLLMQAAMAAPSAANSQPWEFVVVTDPSTLEELRKRLYAGRYEAPAAIVVCGNVGIAHNSAARYHWVQDCSAAAENILIAAVGLGLGAVWIGVYPLPSAIKSVSEVLSIPEHVTPLCIIYVGYPAEEKPPRARFDEERIHWERYDPRKWQSRPDLSEGLVPSEPS